MTLIKSLLPLLGLFIANCAAYAGPPALTTASFIKHDLDFELCQQSAKEIMGKMNLEIEDHGNGTIGGFGEQSVAIVNCHRLDDATYVQVAVSSQQQEAAETIMHYLSSYLRSRSSNQANNALGTVTKPSRPQ
ncbi:MAG: hypothetical protein PHR16_12240 [Methylovulum sp.]|nr:hypothetical protein [Methylovulum sp.]